MELFGGWRVVFSPYVPKDCYYAFNRDGVIAFHDRYAFLAITFWLRVQPRLDELAREARREWDEVRG